MQTTGIKSALTVFILHTTDTRTQTHTHEYEHCAEVSSFRIIKLLRFYCPFSLCSCMYVCVCVRLCYSYEFNGWRFTRNEETLNLAITKTWRVKLVSQPTTMSVHTAIAIVTALERRERAKECAQRRVCLRVWGLLGLPFTCKSLRLIWIKSNCTHTYTPCAHT